jgi:hypothetical protein
MKGICYFCGDPIPRNIPQWWSRKACLKEECADKLWEKFIEGKREQAKRARIKKKEIARGLHDETFTEEDDAWIDLAIHCKGNDVAVHALGVVRDIYFERWVTIERLRSRLNS